MSESTTRQLLLDNLYTYKSRQQLFEFLHSTLNVSYRSIQRIYKKICKPKFNHLDPDIIEYRGEILSDPNGIISQVEDEPPSLDIETLSLEASRAEIVSKVNRRLRNKIKFLSDLNLKLVQSLTASKEFLNDLELSTLPDTVVTITDKNPIVIIQLSDLHLAEAVHLPHNKYDLTTASKRLRKFISEALPFIKQFKTKHVILALTGDLINSDRRLEEAVTNEMPRSIAFIAALELIYQILFDLSHYINKITVVSTPGNESRLLMERTSSLYFQNDNWDTIVHYTLEQKIQDDEALRDIVSFVPYPFLPERLLKVKGKIIAFTHGIAAGSRLQTFADRFFRKYSEQGIQIDYLIFGHKHHVEIHDSWSACGSLVGVNAYAQYTLNTISPPSQTLYIVDSERIIPIPISLTDVSSITPYRVKLPELTVQTSSIPEIE